MKSSPMNTQNDMDTAPDRLVTVVIEVPIDTLQFAGALVFGCQRVIQGQIDG